MYGIVGNSPIDRNDRLGLVGFPYPGDPPPLPKPPTTPPPAEENACAKFEQWYQNEKADPSWMDGLPDCPCHIWFETRCTPIYGYGATINGHKLLVSSDSEAGWKADPSWIVLAKKVRFGSTAEHVIRSKPEANGARQECNYDASGDLLTHGPGAGTVDRGSGSNHNKLDVEPYFLAEQCDKIKGGNSSVLKYLEVRPINNGNGCRKNP